MVDHRAVDPRQPKSGFDLHGRLSAILFKCQAAARARPTLLILRVRELYAGELIHALDDSRPCWQNDAPRPYALGDRP
ncbi:hypothetical protein EUX57_07605 [Pseudomonas orientalis]|uniref:Uncharacterized protein n=1 Tax=Pseudomonas orientalis TaxID=76758 RepID=A0A4Q7D756_9PSED|nr:hypothetical protein EUX57_07605 [Pseudomonas orientalis]